jgi:ferrochelatase
MGSVFQNDRKIAIVLFNLGGPDSLEAVEPFLFNLFNDPAIIGLPGLLRTPLARFIAKKRAAKKAIPIYEEMGGRSPILPETEAQARALEDALKNDAQQVKAFICMRYWHPMSKEVVAQVKEYAPDRIILLPLYPQLSTTTTESSIKDWQRECRRQGLNVPTNTLCCYPTEPHFINAYADLIRPKYEEAKQHGAPRVLFSAHGLPEKIINKGDPYQWQVEQTTQAIVKALNIDGLDYVNCYQSRVGPLKWIGPNTETVIEETAKAGIPIVLAPIAFVSEHSETLVELDIEYRELCESFGMQHYFRVPTVSTHESFIAGLADMCRNLTEEVKLCPHTGSRICPTPWKRCPNKP